MAYTKTNWSNGEAPAINGTNLNKIEQGIYDATYVDGVKVGSSIDGNYKTNILIGKNLFNLNEYKPNILINDSGVETINTGWNTSYFIKVESGKNYALSYVSSLTASPTRISFYTSNGSFISRTTPPVSSPYSFTIPSNSSYVRISYASSDISNIQLEKGSTATTYQAYIPPTINVDGEDIYVKGQNEVYSTSEQRIGTWIDGKPLYRKVITLSQTIPSNTSSSSATVSIFNFVSNNAKEVIVENCRVENSDASVILYVPYAGGQPRYITIAKVSGNINLSFFNAFSNESVKIVATLKYTKTTD